MFKSEQNIFYVYKTKFFLRKQMDANKKMNYAGCNFEANWY